MKKSKTATKTKKKTPKCSGCGKAGHNVRTCPG